MTDHTNTPIEPEAAHEAASGFYGQTPWPPPPVGVDGCTGCELADDGDGESGPHLTVSYDEACPVYGEAAYPFEWARHWMPTPQDADRDDPAAMARELAAIWTEYVEESAHEGESITLADFGLYLQHRNAG